MSADTVSLQHAEQCDQAFENALAQLIERNPALFASVNPKLSQEMLREFARTFFYLGYAAGEDASL